MTPATATISQEVRARCAAHVGRVRVTDDSICPETAEKLRVLLGAPPLGDVLPPTYHWAYFNRAVPEADQGHDLHERTGIFLPDAPFTRRMWAAGDLTVHEPLEIGVAARRHSEVSDVAFKHGKSGAMCFVTVTHSISQRQRPRLTERQTIVYRDRASPESALRAPDDPVPDGCFTHSDSQLYFYSALTHNGHRIHWDRDFCRDVEGYPDLVVHGPLMATELCEALRRRHGPLRFSYRALAPVFVTTPVRLLADPPGPQRSGRIERSDGTVSMTARLTLLQPPPAPA